MSDQSWRGFDPAQPVAFTVVDTAPEKARERLDWDPETPGLAQRLRPGCAPVWVLVRKRDGKTVKRTLGRTDRLTREQARGLVAALFDGEVEAPARPAPETLADLAAVYLADAAGRWKPSTAARHGMDVRRRIVPHLGRLRLDAIEPHHIRRWRDDLAGGPATANRAMAVLSGMLRHAEVPGLRRAGSNPCAGMRRRKSSFDAHYLTPTEYSRLGSALCRLEGDRPFAVAALRFIALTGCRRGEATRLEWDMIDGARAVLPDSKTGPKTLWLGAPVQALLRDAPRTASPLVFPGAGGDDIGAELTAVWAKVREAAGLPRVRVHDLRHSFASVAAGAGVSLRTIGGLLGHRDLGTTDGYAHLDRGHVAAAAERVGARMIDALGSAAPPDAPAARARRGGRPARPKPDGPRPPDALAHVDAFLKGSMTMTAFCRRHLLDPAAFHSAVLARRAELRGART